MLIYMVMQFAPKTPKQVVGKNSFQEAKYKDREIHMGWVGNELHPLSRILN